MYMELLDSAAAIVSGTVAGGARVYVFLQRLGKAVGVGRVCLAGVEYRPKAGEVRLRILCEWTAGGIAGKEEGGQSVAYQPLPPGWAKRLMAGFPVHGRFPASPGSVLMVPVFCGSELRGILEFRSRVARRGWRRSDVGTLKAVAGILGSVMAGSGAPHAVGACSCAVVDDPTVPFCRLSPDGAIAYASDSFCALFYRARDDVIGISVSALFSPEIMKKLPNVAGFMVTPEFRAPGADGGKHCCRSVCRTLLDDRGAVCGYRVFGCKSTEFKQQEVRSIGTDDRMFTLLAEAVYDAVVVLDRSARITYWNRAAEDLFGYTADEVVGHDAGQLFSPEHVHLLYLEGFKHAVAAAAEGVVRLRFPDVSLVRKGGAVFPAALSIAAVLTRGAWFGIGVVRDTTAEKIREQAILTEAERIGTLLRIAARLNGVVPFDAALDLLCEETARALRVSGAVIYLYDLPGDLLAPARSFGVPEEVRKSLPPIPQALYEREVERQGSAFVIPDKRPWTDVASGKKMPGNPLRPLASAAILHGRTLIGALNVMTLDTPRSLSPEELTLLKGIADMAALAIADIRFSAERAGHEHQLQALLDEKTALLKEVHHRVKNNMQVIASLLSLQGRLTENAVARACIRESENRVKSLALAHENFYRSESIAAVDAGDYLLRLVNDLLRLYAPPVHVSVDVETEKGLVLPGDVAIPLGLLLNELVSNSLRHGFAGRSEGAIAIRIVRATNRRLTIEYRDDGAGIPGEFAARPPATLGLQLVRILAAQLEGTVTFRRGEPGTIVEITIGDGAGEGRMNHG
jgi:PAS domain S-box-containing protein